MSMQKADGYRGIWYWNGQTHDQYVYVYSGGLGTYCAKHIPFAWHAADVNKTFFCYGGAPADDPQHLLHMVSFYDHATGLVPRPTVLLDKQTGDAHDNPVIQLDGDGFVWIFSSSHGTSRPSYIFRSRRPYDVDDFEQIADFNFSYPQPKWIAGRGFCFVHTRYVEHQRTLCCRMSPDGRTWSEARLLSHVQWGHYHISGQRDGKVAVAFNFHPHEGRLNARTNLYFMESADMGQTWQTAGGQTLDLPLAEVNNPALVRDFQAEGLLVYLKDLNFDADGRPIVLVLTSRGYRPGPENQPRTWTTCRWTGSDWDFRGQIVSDNNYDTGCLHVEGGGTWRIIGPTEPGPQAFNTGGEMAVWTSADEGATWTRQRQITSASEYNHTYARRPVHAHPDFCAFWADGHARQPSPSRLYFCDRTGRHVRRLPMHLSRQAAEPERIGR